VEDEKVVERDAAFRLFTHPVLISEFKNSASPRYESIRNFVTPWFQMLSRKQARVWLAL
jgi:hypothetical protein